MVEQRYQAVLAVLADGRTVAEVAGQWSVSRQTVHSWLARYEAAGLSGLADRSHRPISCPHQLGADVVDVVLGLRRSRPYWGPRRLVLELARKGIDPVPSESAVYRALVRAGGDRADSAAAPAGDVEAVGTRLADGVVANGCGRRVLAR